MWLIPHFFAFAQKKMLHSIKFFKNTENMPDKCKEAKREVLKEARKKLSLEFQTNASSKICTTIQSLRQYRYAKNIALYKAHNGEVNLNSIWRRAPLHGKKCFFPTLTKNKELVFLPATPNTSFRLNKYGIEEPEVIDGSGVNLEALDIVFMPLVGFDESGTRLGMGGGYYDRTLAKQKPKLLVGLAYNFQKQDHIYRESWDIPLDITITEKKIYIHNDQYSDSRPSP